jgi:hypothetical protein
MGKAWMLSFLRTTVVPKCEMPVTERTSLSRSSGQACGASGGIWLPTRSRTAWGRRTPHIAFRPLMMAVVVGRQY